MNKQQASLLLMRKVMVSKKETTNENKVSMNYVATFNANLMALGFTLSLDVMQACTEHLTREEFEIWANEVQDLLIKYNGSRINMKPMYPNFPKQVMETSELELYLNALLHYLSNGNWTPSYEETLKFRTESILTPKVIGLTDDNELMGYVKTLAESPVAMSSQQKEIFDYLLEEYKYKLYSNIMIMPNKENMAHVLHSISKLSFEEDKNIWHSYLANYNINTITDVLRLAVKYLDGDPSFSERYVFQSIKRADRRFLLSLIDKLYAKNHTQVLEDAARYQGLWVIVLEQLHPGDYAKKYIYANQFASKVREDKLRTWYSKLEKAYTENDLNKVVTMLEKRPGEFARRLERTVRKACKDDINGTIRAMNVVERFSKVADKVDSTILLQLHAYFGMLLNNIKEEKERDVRTFFPKGKISVVYVREEDREPIPNLVLLKCKSACREALIAKYKDKEALGNVYFDSNIKDFTVPLKLRNASSQLQTISRGSRFTIPEDTNVLRLYTWWKNFDNKEKDQWSSKIDVDLSVKFYDKEFNSPIRGVSYMNLKTDGCYHSGDITSAPNGAAEFIDIEIDKLLNQDIKYIVMSLNNFSGYNYSEMPECFAGVMVLDKVRPNEKVFDPAKSLIRSDISVESDTCIPMVFDLETREVIWVDSITPRDTSVPNNIEFCKDSITNLIRGIISAAYPTLEDLVNIHIAARDGKLVENKEDADIIFSLEEGITPYSLEVINSQWI